MIKQNFADKFAFTPDENRRFTRMNYTKLVYTNARFEGVKTALPKTQTIMDGMSVAKVSIVCFYRTDKTMTICNNQKNGPINMRFKV